MREESVYELHSFVETKYKYIYLKGERIYLPHKSRCFSQRLACLIASGLCYNAETSQQNVKAEKSCSPNASQEAEREDSNVNTLSSKLHHQ